MRFSFSRERVHRILMYAFAFAASYPRAFENQHRQVAPPSEHWKIFVSRTESARKALGKFSAQFRLYC